MNVYLHEGARNPEYRMHVAPGADGGSRETDSEWFEGDKGTGKPKQYQLVFKYGVLETDTKMGKYLVSRGLAHKSQLLRQVRKLFDRAGKQIEAAYDQNGNPYVFDEAAA
jgi:hypothetical protein